MTHPCAGHPCDHCYLCDVVGICCQTVPASPQAAINASDGTLRQAILAERGSVVSLSSLIHVEAEFPSASDPPPPSPVLALPAPRPLPPLFVQQREKGAAR